MAVNAHLMFRVKQEYTEMPGLTLTIRQASRLWNLSSPICEQLLAALVDERFLVQTERGAFLRPAGGMLRRPSAVASQPAPAAGRAQF